MSEQKNTRTIILAIILVVALAGAGAYVMMSRGGQDGAAPDVAITPVADTAASTAEAEATPAPAAVVPAENAPLTLTALQYQPERAQLSVGIPAVTSLLATVAPFVQELFQTDLNVAEELGLIAQDLAKDMGVEESDDLAAVLTAMGIDSAQGAAVFLNLDELVEVAYEAASSGAAPPEMPDPSTVKAIAVIPVTDGEKAEASLKKLTGDMLSGVATTEKTAGDIRITVYEGIGGYFATETVLALGTDIEMLKEAAAHEGAPATLRYGSASCPPDDVHEAVMLIHGEKFIPVVEKFMALLDQIQPTASFYGQMQLDKMKEMYANASGEPLLISLSVRDDALELKSKIDTEAYPTLLESMGTAQPLRWAQLLPENTLAFLTLAFTPEAKTQIKDVYLENLPDEYRNAPYVDQAIQYGTPVLDMLGQEISLAITGMDPLDFPTIFLVVELANVMQANVFLPMIPQLPEGDPYRDVQIKAINFPSPIQFYFALVGDAIVLSNSDVGIQGLIDLVKDEQTSGFFEALDPPLNPETPVYQALVLKPELYTDLIDPLASFAGQSLPAEVGDVFETLGELFSDLRFFSEMEGSWLSTRVSVIRKAVN